MTATGASNQHFWAGSYRQAICPDAESEIIPWRDFPERRAKAEQVLAGEVECRR